MVHLDQMTTAAQIRAGRALIDFSQPELAKAAGVSRTTLTRGESDNAVPPAAPMAVAYLRKALEAAGVKFIGKGKAVGVRMGPRRRVSRGPIRPENILAPGFQWRRRHNGTWV